MEIEKPKYFEMAFPNAIVLAANGTVADENVYQYEFLNLSSCPVSINGMFLDRYFSGNRLAPSIIPGSNIRWIPQINAGERDTSSYTVTFIPDFYKGNNLGFGPFFNLIVMKKQLFPMPHNRRAR